MATRLHADHRRRDPINVLDVAVSDRPSTSLSANSGINTPILEGSRKGVSRSTDAEMLVRTLRNVVIPLVSSSNGDDYHPNRNALGPDGEQFVVALQKFMLSFLCSQKDATSGIEVEPNGVDCKLPVEKAKDTLNTGSLTNSPSDNATNPIDIQDTPPDAEPLPASSPSERAITNPEDIDLELTEGIREVCHDYFSERHLSAFPRVRAMEIYVEPPDAFKQRFLENTRKALRKHVFNTMPIRLLCFKPHASGPQITLIERDEIYAHIALNLENSTDFAEVWRRITLWKKIGTSEETTQKSLNKKLINYYSRYAILSHTWFRGVSGEITYGDWNRGGLDTQQTGYQKLVNFCKAAWEDHRVAFGWMDTVCINKESSAELDESIRSMYKWYRNAHICVTYLAETVALSDMPNDTWFTRGWTLQELFAPTHMKFYNADWNKLVGSSENDKDDPIILEQIEQATTIAEHELKGHVAWIPISRKMQMAAKRQVTREEDIAYSLMGIFDVSMSIAYGEGSERAFSRLLQEILNSSNDVADIFNWGSSSRAPCTRISALLPCTPQGYLRRSPHYQSVVHEEKPIKPLMLTHVGLRVTVMLMQAISIENPSPQYDSIGDYHAIVDVHIFIPNTDLRGSVYPGSYSVLDSRISGDDGWKEQQQWFQLTLGIFNIGGDGQEITIPKLCLAVCFDPIKSANRVIQKCPTEEPIVFNLKKRPSSDVNKIEHKVYRDWENWYYIRRSELRSHGMKLTTLYL